ncbi:MAG: hypothetical protein JOZ62_21715 [Acidobacteriaceae bacterium]|nr:hypothetical protein [Acidobacteriaceae bacterium]
MMRRSLISLATALLCVFGGLSAATQAANAVDTPASNYGALSAALVERAQNEVTRIQALVADGTLPKSRLEQAKMQLADAQDEVILARTFYGELRVQDMTSEDAKSMIEAAQRRVDRQEKLVDERHMLLDNGILAKSEFAIFQNELDSRTRVLELAQNRLKLLDGLREMADQEQRLERAARINAPELKDVMTRYDGNGHFNLGDLPTISSEFQRRFHHALPISALGQTMVHQSMGLDHRNRVDVALNPDQTEGVWLQQLLERLHVPYLAFRSALAGAATAPHIHIGLGSVRLKLAQR